MKSTFKERKAMFKFRENIWRYDPDGYIVMLKDRNQYKYYDVKPRRLGTKDKLGYWRLSLTVNYKKKVIFAHRMIWQYHYGDIPEGLEINHKNGIKHDNRIENLEIVTHSENAIHSANVLGKVLKNNRKLTNKQIIKIREIYIPYKITALSLANKYNVTETQIFNIVKRKCWAEII